LLATASITSALVTEGNSTPMFTIVATDPVRIYGIFVDVPQSVAPSVRPGLGATIVVRELGDRKVEGTVARAAEALDPELHTMTTEIRVPNPDGALLTGMFVRAQLSCRCRQPLTRTGASYRPKAKSMPIGLRRHIGALRPGHRWRISMRR
jgi:hypothetical protein